MEFQPKQAIYQQIGDYVCENILSGTWKAGDRIPSVREMAVSVEVNPNTVARSYAYLQDKGIICKERGIGYFVDPDARANALALKRGEFLDKELGRMFRAMDLLGVGIEELRRLYREHRQGRPG